MNRYDIQLSSRLDEVKPSKEANDIFLCPAGLSNAVALFLDDYGIEYAYFKDTQLYPAEKIQRVFDAYEGLAHAECGPGMDMFFTPFDAEELFVWSLQLLGDTIDPAYREYLNKRGQEAEEYYRDVYLPLYSDGPCCSPDGAASSTSFESEEAMNEQIRQCVREHGNLNKLVSWFASDSQEELTLVYRNPKKAPNAGSGLSFDHKTHKIAEYTTKTMILRLAKDCNFSDNFCIVTAFPWIRDDSEPTRRDILEAVQQTQMYQDADSIGRAFYDMACHPDYDPEKIRIGTETSNGGCYAVYVAQQDPDNPEYTHKIVLTKDGCVLQTQDIKEIYKQWPEMAAMAEYGYSRLVQHMEAKRN